jgi:hypothetical protein
VRSGLFIHDYNRQIYFHNYFLVLVTGVKMGRLMVVVVHKDDDAVKTANGRHGKSGQTKDDTVPVSILPQRGVLECGTKSRRLGGALAEPNKP